MNNRGMSLIELLAAVTILTASGIMTVAFLDMSVKLNRKTAEEADIRIESQNITKNLTESIMGSKVVYIRGDENGTAIFIGDFPVKEDKTAYYGEAFFFEEAGGKLYQKKDEIFSIEGKDSLKSKDIRENVAREEYMVSDRLAKMDIEIGADGSLLEERNIQEARKGKATISFKLEFSMRDGSVYAVRATAAARNDIEIIWKSFGADPDGSVREMGRR